MIEEPRARYRLGMLGRWIIVHPKHDQLAWSGSSWVPHEAGIGTIAQVSNFDTREAAEVAAREQITPRPSSAATNDAAPCPFCAGRGQLHGKLREGRVPSDPRGTAYFYVCDSCAAVGGWGTSETQALKLWNMRTEPARS